MEILASILITIFFLGLIIGILCLPISFIKKSFKFTKKQILIAILICFGGLIGSAVFYSKVETPETRAKIEQQQKEKQEAKIQKEKEKEQEQAKKDAEKEEANNKAEQEHSIKGESLEVNKEENNAVKEEKEQTAEVINNNINTDKDLNSEQQITIEKISEFIEGYLGSEDKVTDIKFENETIKISVELGDPAPLTKKDLAVSRYSSISDRLLEFDFWNTLTVKFDGVGTVTMNYNQAKDSGYGKYFESIECEKQLSK